MVRARGAVAGAVFGAMLAAGWAWWPRGAAPGPAAVATVPRPAAEPAPPATAPASGAAPAAVPRAAPGPTATPASVGSEPALAALIDRALAARSPEATAAALQRAAQCDVVQGLSEERVAALAEARGDGSPLQRQQALQARQRAAGYCAALADPAVAARVESLRQQASADAARLLALQGKGRKRADEPWSAAEYQAALLALGEPAARRADLAAVLSMLPTIAPVRGAPTLDTRERLLAQQIAYQELSGDRDPGSWANTMACLQHTVCDVAALAQGQRAAQAAAQQLVAAVRAQQWALIGLRP
jgi:hypothetical protein